MEPPNPGIGSKPEVGKKPQMRARAQTSSTASNLKPEGLEEKPYRKVVRKQPKPATISQEAFAQIDARENALSQRAAKFKKGQDDDEIEIHVETSNKPQKSVPVPPAALAKGLSSALMRNPTPSSVDNKRPTPKADKRPKSMQDQDMYDLPNLSRTSSELAELEREMQDVDLEEDDEDDGESKINTLFQNKSNIFVLIGLISLIVLVIGGATALGIFFLSKSSK